MLFVGKLARRRGRRGEKHTQEVEGGPREYNMFRSFQKSLSVPPLETLCSGHQRRRIMKTASIYCMCTLYQTQCLMCT